MMMKAFIWNIRLVKTQQAFHRLQILHRHHISTLIALMDPFQEWSKLVAIAMEKNDSVEENVEVEVVMDTKQQITLNLFS